VSTAAQGVAASPRPMLHALAKSWWLVLLRGIAGILFGLLAFVWPGLTLVTLVLLYGAYALVDGAFALAAAFTGAAKPKPTWWLIVVGLLGIAAGAVTFFWPGVTALVLIFFIGGWAIAHGIFEIIGAMRTQSCLGPCSSDCHCGCGNIGIRQTTPLRRSQPETTPLRMSCGTWAHPWSAMRG
jgi:uncharacterized membrane protein HdeD (DUF308 family)